MARNFCSVNYGWVINSMTTFGLLLQQDVTCLSSRLDKIQTEKKIIKKYFSLSKNCCPISLHLLLLKSLFDQIKVEKSGHFLMDIANIYRNVN